MARECIVVHGLSTNHRRQVPTSQNQISLHFVKIPKLISSNVLATT
ncbi:hypothetical protein DM47_2012 [Burkholderia mallei]|nr:hypothetical protein DM46_1326 [Burkholderia mallei]KOT16815.1 hypothetical protein DM47_2012 [Burkholderia mallei]